LSAQFHYMKICGNTLSVSVSLGQYKKYHNSALSIWLSVDPMSDKYPSTSPYTYCGNNPVRLVDPNGREIGEYFDMDGKWLGTDGKNDGLVHFVNDANSQKQLRRDARKDRYTTSSIKSEVTTSITVLDEIIDVFDRTAGGNNNGKYEEGSAFKNDLFFPCRSERGVENHVDLKLENGSTSIHSHSFVETLNAEGGYDIYVPEEPSKKDKQMFTHFTLNVIVGKTKFDPNENDRIRYDRAYFYNSSVECILDLDMSTIRQISWHTNHSFHLPKK